MSCASPRPYSFHFHFTPTGASWLNLVERFFTEITRKRLRRGTFRRVPALIAAIRSYVRAHNKDPHPFIWTASASTILRKIKRCKEALAACRVPKTNMLGLQAAKPRVSRVWRISRWRFS
jgi:hypothetical protein